MASRVESFEDAEVVVGAEFDPLYARDPRCLWGESRRAQAASASSFGAEAVRPIADLPAPAVSLVEKGLPGGGVGRAGSSVAIEAIYSTGPWVPEGNMRHSVSNPNKYSVTHEPDRLSVVIYLCGVNNASFRQARGYKASVVTTVPVEGEAVGNCSSIRRNSESLAGIGRESLTVISIDEPQIEASRSLSKTDETMGGVNRWAVGSSA